MTRHLYRCPLRWADMDQLGHVNNVTYVDYLQEARVDMLRVHPPVTGGEALAEGVVVVRHEVQYRAPLVFRDRPVSIEVWVSEVRGASFTLAHEVFDETQAGRTVYLRARSVLTPYSFAEERPRRLSPAEREVLERFLESGDDPLRSAVQLSVPDPDRRHRYECTVRFSDVDAYRHVNNVKYFEYYQEARIGLLTGLASAGSGGLHVVVAQMDVDYRTPIFFRESPYAVESWVSEVGRSSFVMESRIVDPAAEQAVLSRARAAVVAVDSATGKSHPLSPEQRDALLDATSVG